MGPPDRRAASGRWTAPLEQVANYTLGAELGRGAAGVVYQGRHRLLDREAAIKLFPACDRRGKAKQTSFLREVKAATKLSHPNILPTFDAGEVDGLPYLVMELVPDGETFQRRLDRDELFEPREAARAMAVVARAVHYAHSEGLLHRDLKPANVLVPADGVPRLGDFGLVSERGEEASHGKLTGTPPYMSPEQISGQALDVRSDVYGLGATLYSLLTGAPPFTAEGVVELAVKVLEEEPEAPSKRRPGLSPALDEVCLRCLNKSPDDRYRDAAALEPDLERVASGSLFQKISRRLRRKPI
ncbi:MAG: serine/threonine protein kinase [Planctomycetes bacterium]|nr:serine/threonine protein kinase [Planctomycetota bacterium]